MYVTAADAYKKKSTYFDGTPGADDFRFVDGVPGSGDGAGDVGSLIAGARYCSRFACPHGHSGSVGTDGRVPPDPCDGRARGRVRVVLVHRVAVARAAATELREAGSVRVRNRSRARTRGALSGQVLFGRDGVHRARRRDRLPVSVRGRVPWTRRVRPLRDGDLRRRPARPVRVPVV